MSLSLGFQLSFLTKRLVGVRVTGLCVHVAAERAVCNEGTGVASPLALIH